MFNSQLIKWSDEHVNNEKYLKPLRTNFLSNQETIKRLQEINI